MLIYYPSTNETTPNLDKIVTAFLHALIASFNSATFFLKALFALTSSRSAALIYDLKLAEWANADFKSALALSKALLSLSIYYLVAYLLAFYSVKIL
jgi:hypothetical protein